MVRYGLRLVGTSELLQYETDQHHNGEFVETEHSMCEDDGLNVWLVDNRETAEDALDVNNSDFLNYRGCYSLPGFGSLDPNCVEVVEVTLEF